jgi:tetratricopeptide (TPR) repeat protein
VLVALATVAGSARASDSEDLIKQGLAERRKRNDREALELFKRAHEIGRGARSVAQMGFAEQALGMWADAERHLDEALSHDGDPWIKKNETVLRKSKEMVGTHLGSIEVWGTPDGAQVLVNGSEVGVLPLKSALRVSVGTVPITVRASGYVEVSRVVEVAAGTMARERFELARKVAPSLGVAGTKPRDGGGRAANKPKPLVDVTARRTEPDEESGSVFSRWWFWTAVGTVVVAGAVTAFLVTRPKDNGCAAGEMCTSIGGP